MADTKYIVLLSIMLVGGFIVAGLTGHAYTQFSWANDLENIGYENTKTEKWFNATIGLFLLSIYNLIQIFFFALPYKKKGRN
jgi:hypothetical protein